MSENVIAAELPTPSQDGKTVIVASMRGYRETNATSDARVGDTD